MGEPRESENLIVEGGTESQNSADEQTAEKLQSIMREIQNPQRAKSGGIQSGLMMMA